MASGQVLEKFRTHYSKADAEVAKWSTSQERAVSLISTVINIMNRLPALEDASNYGQLVDLPNFPAKLFSKQLMAVEDLLADVQVALAEMAKAVEFLRTVHRNAERSIQQDKRLTPAARAASKGPVPSIDQCLEGLHAIWRMHEAEQRLQQALAAQVTYQQKPEGLKEVLRAMAARPNIDSQRLRDMVYVVAATAELRA